MISKDYNGAIREKRKVKKKLYDLSRDYNNHDIAEKDEEIRNQIQNIGEAVWDLHMAQGVISSKVDEITDLEIRIEKLKISYQKDMKGNKKEIEEKEKEMGISEWEMHGEAYMSSESGDLYSSDAGGPLRSSITSSTSKPPHHNQNPRNQRYQDDTAKSNCKGGSVDRRPSDDR